MTFGAECSHCHFVSNNDFDKEVLLWQSYIEDGKRLQTENIALYEKIKDRIKNEFLDDMPSNFDSVFEEFTVFTKSDIISLKKRKRSKEMIIPSALVRMTEQAGSQ